MFLVSLAYTSVRNLLPLLSVLQAVSTGAGSQPTTLNVRGDVTTSLALTLEDLNRLPRARVTSSTVPTTAADMVTARR